VKLYLLDLDKNWPRDGRVDLSAEFTTFIPSIGCKIIKDEVTYTVLDIIFDLDKQETAIIAEHNFR